MADVFKLRMELDKVTAKGAVRYNDGKTHQLYFRPEEYDKMGKPEVILVTIEIPK